MANVLAHTEDFANTTYWRVDTGGVNVTATTYAAPTFAGPSAGPARELEDGATNSTEDIRSDFWYLPGPTQTWPGPTDTSNWTFSIYIRQSTAVFPRIDVQLFGGGAATHSMSMNLSTGDTSFASSAGGPPTGGSENVDSGVWWRFYMTFPNNNDNDMRIWIYPRYSTSLGGSGVLEELGSIIVWGANLTNTSTVQTYEPDPFYSFTSDVPFMTASLPIFR